MVKYKITTYKFAFSIIIIIITINANISSIVYMPYDSNLLKLFI